MGGGFDAYSVRTRRGESFGVRFDPKTGSHIEFPLIPNNPDADAQSDATGHKGPTEDPRQDFIWSLAKLTVSAIASKPFPSGIRKTAEFLVGGMTTSNVKNNLQEIELFGCLSSYRKATVCSIIEALMDDGLLGVTWWERFGDTFPLAVVPPESLKIMENGDNPRFESLRSLVYPETAGYSREQGEFYKDLAQLRSTIAREEGYPPFVVATNSILDQMVRVMPTNPEALKEIRGIGDRFVDRWGNIFLDMIKDTLEDRGLMYSP